MKEYHKASYSSLIPVDWDTHETSFSVSMSLGMSLHSFQRVLQGYNCSSIWAIHGYIQGGA